MCGQKWISGVFIQDIGKSQRGLCFTPSSEQAGLTLDMLGSVMQLLATRHIFPNCLFSSTLLWSWPTCHRLRDSGRRSAYLLVPDKWDQITREDLEEAQVESISLYAVFYKCLFLSQSLFCLILNNIWFKMGSCLDNLNVRQILWKVANMNASCRSV